MRRRILGSKNNTNEGPVEPSKANVLDVVFANKNSEEHELIIVSGGESFWNEFPSSAWEPIGVVVIPGGHGVLKDGDGHNQCGIMSIVPMNCSTPQIGGSKEQGMYWAGNGTDVSSLKNYIKVVVTSSKTSNVANGLSSSYYAYLPMQVSVGGIPTRDSSPYAPSPYIGSDYKSGGYNESYGTTKYDTSTDFNALADFDGPGNTQEIIAQRGEKDYSSWKPTYNNSLTYPAASCCDMFCPIGTKQGDWYLPAMGEIGYICPRYYDINNTISKLYDAYGVGVQLIIGNYSYWSSTEYGWGNARLLTISSGSVDQYSNNYQRYVRAFMRL